MKQFFKFLGIGSLCIVGFFIVIAIFAIIDDKKNENKNDAEPEIVYKNGLSCDEPEVKSLLIEELNSTEYLNNLTAMALLGIKINTHNIRFHKVESVEKLGENPVITACQASVLRTDGKPVDIGFVAEWRNKDDETFFVHVENLKGLRNQWGLSNNSDDKDKSSSIDSDRKENKEEVKPAITESEIEAAYNFSRFEEHALDRCLASGDTQIRYYDCYEEETNLEEKRFQKLKKLAEKVVGFDMSKLQEIEGRIKAEKNKCALDADEHEAETGDTNRMHQAACVLSSQQKAALNLKKLLLNHT